MRPGSWTLVGLGGWLVVALLVAVWPPLLPAWVLLGAVGVGILWHDRKGVLALDGLEVERRVPASLPVGVWTRVQLDLRNHGEAPLRLRVADYPPSESEVKEIPQQLELGAGRGARIDYGVLPLRRGETQFESTEVWCESRWRLWERKLVVGAPSAVRVLPNFRPAVRYALLSVDQRLDQMGIRVRRRRGEGLEFDQLRDYRAGDSERQIDWKATCRRQRLISREYQEEKDQRLVLLIDCGRRMRAQDGPINHFDQVLNAALLLTYAAVQKGDAVGLATFGGPTRWVPPLKGRHATSAVLRAVYDLETTDETPDFLTAAVQLSTRLRRRALVIIVSNLRDEDADDLVPAVRTLARRHLVLLASLKEAALREVLETPPNDLQEAVLLAAVHDYEGVRRQAHDRIAGRGVLTLDSEPENLPVALVNKYLEIKRRGVL
ncbi:MAG: DUF58 domain-containing protein [Thermoanaerobaculia bacterium]|nr:DUF58 domain-containing protein [Thermoanaerobaculia bacterium]